MRSLPGIVTRRIPTRGQASVLFEVRVGGDALALKVPVADSDRHGSMAGREWVYGRLAERVGLPTLPLSAVEVDPERLLPMSPRRLDLRGRSTFTATPLVVLGPKLTWNDLPPADRARLFLWDCAVCSGEGDKIRSSGPRDFHASASSVPHTMLDYEALPDVWDSVLVYKRAASAHAEPPDWLLGDWRGNFGHIADEVASCLDGQTWAYIIDGLNYFWPTSIESLRDEMRRRVDAASAYLR